MSYEKVRSVKILSDDNSIVLESVSSNVSPQTYHKWTFGGTLIDFIKYVGGGVFQITPSANNYYWSAFFSIFSKALAAQNISLAGLYDLDKDNPLWNDVLATFNAIRKQLKENKKVKLYLKNGMYYIGGKAYGRHYYLVGNKEDAKKYPYCQARYMSNAYDWNMEQV